MLVLMINSGQWWYNQWSWWVTGESLLLMVQQERRMMWWCRCHVLLWPRHQAVGDLWCIDVATPGPFRMQRRGRHGGRFPMAMLTLTLCTQKSWEKVTIKCFHWRNATEMQRNTSFSPQMLCWIMFCWLQKQGANETKIVAIWISIQASPGMPSGTNGKTWTCKRLTYEHLSSGILSQPPCWLPSDTRLTFTCYICFFGFAAATQG